MPQITMAVLHARDKLNEKSLKRRAATIRKQIGTAGKWHYEEEEFEFRDYRSKAAFEPDSEYDVSDYAPCGNVKIAELVSLLSLTEGVMKWPERQDAGVVTQVILRVYVNQDTLEVAQYTTADIPDLVEE
ncbi:hypothetical protein EJ03DRAFT_122679 [Teratosphaeria nubilosa]|uniref:Uncharacterized protein n=1 Tax=Teratosphaeria nubilosa TaxID=161662 RepID=A0A6G1L6P3_9PEZI|nr:hypothetical protein EJ03DRAFT_122679 [Teratosphaeria nubilosa]